MYTLIYVDIISEQMQSKLFLELYLSLIVIIVGSTISNMV